MDGRDALLIIAIGAAMIFMICHPGKPMMAVAPDKNAPVPDQGPVIAENSVPAWAANTRPFMWPLPMMAPPPVAGIPR